MNLEKLQHTDKDPWTWDRAIHTDIPGIVNLSDAIDSLEIDSILTKNPTKLTLELHHAVLDQSNGLSKQNVNLARNRETKRLMAWSWIQRGKHMPWANEEMAVAEMFSLDQSLPTLTKMRLTAQAIQFWILWAEVNDIPVLLSTSIRPHQQAFMRLHEEFGFEVRGSFAYKRIGE